MTRKAHYARPEDHDLTDAVFPLFALELHPLGKGAGSGKRSPATARLVFLACQSKESMTQEGQWPLRGDSHIVTLNYDALKNIHQRLRAAGLDGPEPEDRGLLKVIAEFEAEAAAVEVQDNGDYNPLFTSIPNDIDIELTQTP